MQPNTLNLPKSDFCPYHKSAGAKFISRRFVGILLIKQVPVLTASQHNFLGAPDSSNNALASVRQD